MIPPLLIGLALVGLVGLVVGSGGSSSSSGPVEVSYASTARTPPAWIEAALKRIAARAGVSALTVTSTVRSYADQARVMLHNVKEDGEEAQLGLYGDAGDEVVKAIANDLRAKIPDSAIQARAAALIEQLQRSGRIVSRHIENAQFYALDVSPRSLDGQTTAFVNAARNDIAVVKVVAPPVDPAVHVEFKLSAAREVS